MESPTPSLEELIEIAKKHVKDMTPEERRAMVQKQAESWARSEAQWAKDFREGKCKRD